MKKNTLHESKLFASKSILRPIKQEINKFIGSIINLDYVHVNTLQPCESIDVNVYVIDESLGWQNI